MSLSDLARNSFQSGITAAKWGGLCRLYISNQPHRTADDIQTDISNSVLILFRHYPGDPALQNYLKCAIQSGLLSLATFVATFLSAARSPDLHHPATLDMLCRLALDSHYASRMPATGSIIPYSESTIEILGTVQDAIICVRTPILLLSTVSDVSQISTAQAMVHFADAGDMLQVCACRGSETSPRELCLSLSLLLGDDAKAAREAQMMHTLQLALGKGDILGSNSDTDITTCSLVLHSLVFARAIEFGAGDGDHVTAVLIALLRWSSWTRVVFCTQLLLSALTCVAQNSATGVSTKSALIWRAFVIGRLPSLLVAFQSAAEAEGGAELDWHMALQVALAQVLQRSDLLTQCDNTSQSMNLEGGSDRSMISKPFIMEFMYQFSALGLIDSSFIATTYLESRLSVDVSLEDFPACHTAFAEAVGKRFALAHPHDVESLGHICKVLCQCESALDIVSLHLTLAFVEGYDCETVGDPQTAVSHFGDILSFPTFAAGKKNFSAAFLHSAATVHALFDSNSEGIEDTILRATRPKTLLRIVATLFSHAISLCSERKIDKDIQHRGYNAPIHLEVLQTLLLSSYCPQPVLRLSASTILRLFPDTKDFEKGQLGHFDLLTVRTISLRALGLPTEVTPQHTQSLHWTNQPQQAIRNALSAVRAGKGPSLDVDRCLLLISPTKFLGILWSELMVAASMGDIEAPRRIATFVLTMPRCARVEMLVATISSALAFALHLEWALITACNDQRPVLGPPATTMAKGHGPTSDIIVQRLASSAPFMANFPTFVADL
ncbi:hypothetical protein B0H21DRAFT_723485 [Amylocystis lapponica]|nr:hypothetical protein B0H21DRAFT_723485 [Amylocystis lapponica]